MRPHDSYDPMQPPKFSPGFRLSTIDVAVVVIGALATLLLWSITWWWGFVIGFVLAHFFLFCNIVRAARPLELVWAGIFVVLAAATIMLEIPSWPATAAISLAVTVGVGIIEMRKPSYHGFGWQRINPGLPAWWESHIAISQATNHPNKSQRL